MSDRFGKEEPTIFHDEKGERLCTICLHPTNDHPFHHPFTPEGETWTPPKKEKPTKAPTAAQVAAQGVAHVARIITRLTLKLVEKGVLTAMEAEEVLGGADATASKTPPRGDGGDRSAGGTEGTSGGVRGAAAEGFPTPGEVDSGAAEQVRDA